MPAKRLHWVEQLRGLAAVCVLFYHFFYIFHIPVGWAFNHYFQLGILGVVIFFSISGYIIPVSLKQGGLPATVNFLIARVFRLYPAYWLSILLVVLVMGASAKAVLVNLTMVQELFNQDSLLGVYWTLTVEWLYYFVVAGLLLVNRLKNPKAVAGLAILFAGISLAMALARAYIGIKMPLAPPQGLAVMFLATYFSILTERGDSDALRKTLPLGAAVVAGLYASFYFGFSKDWGHNENPWKFFITYSVGLAVFYLYQGRAFRNVVAEFLGKVSYSLYLIHMPVGFLVYNLVKPQGFWPSLGLMFVTMALATTAAWLCYLAVEKPFVALSRTVIGRLKARQVQVPQVNAPGTDG